MAPIRRRLRPVALASLALALAAVGRPQAAPAKNFIWKVTGERTSIYLVGSVHLLTKDFYPLAAPFESSFEASDLLVEEVDFGELLSADAQMRLLTRGMLPSDRSLDSVVSPATLALVGARVEQLGLPLAPLTRFKPWALALTLSAIEWQKAGFDADLGLDKHFYDLAQSAAKPVRGLETADYQISRFDGMSMPEQEKLLTETVKDLDTELTNVGTLADAWKNGDEAGVERIVLKDLKQDPMMYRRLLVERNDNWLPKIEALFVRTAPALVVVGAAHLVGPDGLLAKLLAKGYRIEQM